MPSNITIIPGADQIDFYLGNYTYPSIAANMEPLKCKMATDLNRLVYKNAAGTTYKVLTDASTTVNTPANRVFFADANGAAASDSRFAIDPVTGFQTTVKLAGQASLGYLDLYADSSATLWSRWYDTGRFVHGRVDVAWTQFTEPGEVPIWCVHGDYGITSVNSDGRAFIVHSKNSSKTEPAKIIGARSLGQGGGCEVTNDTYGTWIMNYGMFNGGFEPCAYIAMDYGTPATHLPGNMRFCAASGAVVAREIARIDGTANALQMTGSIQGTAGTAKVTILGDSTAVTGLYVHNTGNVSVGIATDSGYRMHVTTTYADAAGTNLRNVATLNCTNATSRDIFAAYNEATVFVADGVVNGGSAYALYNLATRSSDANNKGRFGTLTASVTVIGHGNVDSAAVTDLVEGFVIQPYKNAGTISTMVCLNGKAPSGSGTITSGYYIYDATGFKNYIGYRLGIGTSSPSYPLHVVGESFSTIMTVGGASNDICQLYVAGQSKIASFLVGAEDKEIIYAYGSGTTGKSRGILSQSGTNSSDFSLHAMSRGGVSMIYARGDGNVGIGHTSPDRKLHVETEDSVTNNIEYIARFSHFSTGTVVEGSFGVGLEFEIESTGCGGSKTGALSFTANGFTTSYGLKVTGLLQTDAADVFIPGAYGVCMGNTYASPRAKMLWDTTTTIEELRIEVTTASGSTQPIRLKSNPATTSGLPAIIFEPTSRGQIHSLLSATAFNEHRFGDCATNYASFGSDGTLVFNGTAALKIPRKTDTADPTAVEGMIYYNTYDNVCKAYLDGAWRTLASW